MTNSEMLPEKPSLSSLPSPRAYWAVGPQRQNCEAAKKAASKDDGSRLCERRDQHNSPVPPRLRSQAPEKKRLFFPPQTAPSPLSISMAGPWRKDNIDSLFIPFCASALMLKVNIHRGQKESDSCCYFTMKSKLGSECCSRNSWKVICRTVSLNLAVW